MSNNFIKAYTIKYSEDVRKIDSNEAAERMEREFFDQYVADNIALKQISFDEVKAGLEKPQISEEELIQDEDSASEGTPHKKEFKEGINFAAIFGYDDDDDDEPVSSQEEPTYAEESVAEPESVVSTASAAPVGVDNSAALEEIARMKDEAESLLVRAKQEADDIVSDARAKASDIRDEARSEGYSEAIARAQEDIDARMAEVDQFKAECEAAYEKQVSELEPAFVEMAIELSEKLIGIHSDDKKEILLYLLDCGMNKVPRSNTYLIRVPSMAEEDIEQIKTRLSEEAAEDAVVEVIEDKFLDGTQCLIETDSRIFDCSLDSMRKSLYEAIRLLSISR